MINERTLVIIKPDIFERDLISNVLSIYNSLGLKAIKIQIRNAKEEEVAAHYSEHKDKPFFNDLVEYLMRTPIITIVYEGKSAVSVVRKANGATDPAVAEEGTIRKLYGISKSENSVHGSDSLESAEREIEIWFGKFDKI